MAKASKPSWILWVTIKLWGIWGQVLLLYHHLLDQYQWKDISSYSLITKWAVLEVKNKQLFGQKQKNKTKKRKQTNEKALVSRRIGQYLLTVERPRCLDVISKIFFALKQKHCYRTWHHIASNFPKWPIWSCMLVHILTQHSISHYVTVWHPYFHSSLRI